MDELQLIEKPILNWKSIQRSHKMACDKEFMGVVSYKCQYCHDNKLIELFDLMPHTILLDGHKTKRLVKYGYCDCIRKESKENDIFPMFFHIENTKTGKPIYDKSKFNYGIHKIKVMLYEFIKEMKDLKDKWESINLGRLESAIVSKSNGASIESHDFVELVSIEDEEFNEVKMP